MRTAPASASFLQLAFSGFSVVVVPFVARWAYERALTLATPQHLVPILARIEDAADDDAAGEASQARSLLPAVAFGGAALAPIPFP